MLRRFAQQICLVLSIQENMLSLSKEFSILSPQSHSTMQLVAGSMRQVINKESKRTSNAISTIRVNNKS